MTVDDIIESWKKISNEACTHGTERHEFGESAFYYMIGEYDKILPEFKNRITEDGGFMALHPKEEAIVKFYEDKGKGFPKKQKIMYFCTPLNIIL